MPTFDDVRAETGVPGEVTGETTGAVACGEAPLSCFISFGPWIAATSRKTPPSTTAAMRARRSRTWAGVRAFFAAAISRSLPRSGRRH